MSSSRLDATQINQISGQIIDAAIAVHRAMGPGLLESVYHFCLVKELQNRGLIVQRYVSVPLHYKGEPLEKEYEIDMLVENEVVIELKAVEEILPVHEAQLLSYIKLSKKRLGLLINFNVPVLKQGRKRLVNNL
jgi:GxxExxY protein